MPHHRLQLSAPKRFLRQSFKKQLVNSNVQLINRNVLRAIYPQASERRSVPSSFAPICPLFEMARRVFNFNHYTSSPHHPHRRQQGRRTADTGQCCKLNWLEKYATPLLSRHCRKNNDAHGQSWQANLHGLEKRQTMVCPGWLFSHSLWPFAIVATDKV